MFYIFTFSPASGIRKSRERRKAGLGKNLPQREGERRPNVPHQHGDQQSQDGRREKAKAGSNEIFQRDGEVL